MYFQFHEHPLVTTTLRKVDDKEFTLFLTVFWMLSWHDPRLTVRDTNESFIAIDPQMKNSIWVPEVELFPMKSVKKHKSFHDDGQGKKEVYSYHIVSIPGP